VIKWRAAKQENKMKSKPAQLYRIARLRRGRRGRGGLQLLSRALYRALLTAANAREFAVTLFN
jgi:hypothetical protein